MEKVTDKVWNFFKNLRLPGYSGIIGFLGAFAGSSGTSKLWRRAGISIFVTIAAYITLGFHLGWIKSLWTVTYMSMWGGLAIGHGIPADTWPSDPNADEGSFLGQLFFKLFKRNHLWADILTRGTIGLIQSISLLSIPLLKGNWIVYGLASVGIILSQAIVSWRSLGIKTVKIFGKTVDLLWSDVINYSIIGTMIYFVISH